MRWGFPLNPLAVEEVKFRTHLLPEQCQQRLQRRMASRSFKGVALSRADFPVWGWVSPHGFAISKRLAGRNSWQSVVAGRFVQTPDGTQVLLSIHLNRIILTVEVAWAGVVLYALVTMFTTHVVSLPALAFLSLFIPIHVAGRWGARREAEDVTRFLRETLEDVNPRA